MKPICIPCQRFFKPKKNGFYFIEGMPAVDGARPGKVDASAWKPYKIWSGDVWECPDCKATIISGTGRGPVAEHYQEDFVKTGTNLNAFQFQVNDC
jgi:hypothetical protein